MPIYEYKCKKCDHEFETKQNRNDSPKKKCPSCGKFKLYKVISEPIIIIRGESTTLGQASERNSKKLGKDKIQELDAEKKKNKKEEPWYAQGAPATRQEIQKMTKHQKASYIMKGKK
jgi:putative FmdB family regulatory protein